LQPFDILDASVSKPLYGGPSFSLRHRLRRGLFRLAWLVLATWTPRQAHPWRRWLLNLFGAKLERHADVRASARVWYPPNLRMAAHATIADQVEVYNMAPLDVGAWALISQRATLCGGTHDYNSPDFQLLAKPIVIGPQSWVAAEAFVGPGVTIGEGAIVGARAVAMHDVPPWTVQSGNPAQFLRARPRRPPPKL
jgi:putative colanic acid biosynthesis acetyltransferase WcaF